jgi:hypothetical protein
MLVTSADDEVRVAYECNGELRRDVFPAACLKLATVEVSEMVRRLAFS